MLLRTSRVMRIAVDPPNTIPMALVASLPTTAQLDLQYINNENEAMYAHLQIEYQELEA